MENTAIDTALDAKTFDVLSFIEQVAYPTASVTIFTDIASAKEYGIEKAEWEKSDEKRPAEEDDAHLARLEELEAKLKASALTFNLRGFPPGLVSEIIDTHASEENPNGADAYVISKAIVSVTNAEGLVDDRAWSADDVNKFKTYISEGQYSRLLEAVAGVVFNAAVFDQMTDAGFLGRGSDVAPKL